MADLRMGSSNVFTSTAGIRFADGTEQDTAAIGASGGTTIALDANGISIMDPFGGGVQTTSTSSYFGAADSGGGVGQFFDGTQWNTGMGDGNGNSLLLGLVWGSNYNLSNEHTTSGIVNPSGALTNLYGTPVNVIGSLQVNGVPILSASGGSAIVADATGISLTDPFGGGVFTSDTSASLGAAGSGGGFGEFYDGTQWNTVMGDGNGNGLLLGQAFGSNYNLSNQALSSGIVNPAGATTLIYGTPVNIIGSLQVNGVPVGGSPVTKAQRVHVGVIASATPSAITTLTWASPFADNNYSVVASVEIAETPPNGAATEIITVSSFQKSAAGAGLTFVVCNASSGVHDVTVNFIAIHD